LPRCTSSTTDVRVFRPASWLPSCSCKPTSASPTRKPRLGPPSTCAGKSRLASPSTNTPSPRATLQVFRAQLVLHEKLPVVFKRSLQFARQIGYHKKRKIKVALDTSTILGCGAVKDTYNLLGDGVDKLVRIMADLACCSPDAWAKAHNLERYLGSARLKGGGSIDWEDAKERQQFLTAMLADAERLLTIARQPPIISTVCLARTAPRGTADVARSPVETVNGEKKTAGGQSSHSLTG